MRPWRSRANVRDPVVAEGDLYSRRPAAVSARHALGQMLADVILGCLEQILPDAVPAEGASCIWNPVLLSSANAGIGARWRPRGTLIDQQVLVPGAGIEPARSRLRGIFLPATAFAAPPRIARRLCGLDFLFVLSPRRRRRGPSSLYTFRPRMVRGAA